MVFYFIEIRYHGARGVKPLLESSTVPSSGGTVRPATCPKTRFAPRKTPYTSRLSVHLSTLIACGLLVSSRKCSRNGVDSTRRRHSHFTVHTVDLTDATATSASILTFLETEELLVDSATRPQQPRPSPTPSSDVRSLVDQVVAVLKADPVKHNNRSDARPQNPKTPNKRKSGNYLLNI